MPLDFSLARKRLGSMPMCLALVPLVAMCNFATNI